MLDNFSMDQDAVGGWFQDDSKGITFIVHFISIVIPLAQIISRQIPEVRHPLLYRTIEIVFTKGV